MRLLPKLATRGGAVRLPLSDATAQRLLFALLGEDLALRARYVAAALADDPVLVVWTLCRAAADGHDDLRTIGQLAGWLAALPATAWVAETPSNEPSCVATDADVDNWADRCVAAINVSTLATRWAEHVGVDAERARLLGLASAAPQWLSAATCDAATFVPARALPDWLTGALVALEAPASGSPTSPAECVRTARGMGADSGDNCPFAFDRAAHQARMIEARDNWCRRSAGGELLQLLSSKLARLEQLEGDFQRTLEAEKLDSLKELAYGASHEINNPLANISARAQTLLADERDPERRRKLAAINSQAFRAHEMIADMMLFARPPQPKLDRVDLVVLVAGLIEELAPWAEGQQTRLVLHAPAEPLTVVADKTQLAVAVRSLCVNALEALSTGGHVELTLRRHSGGPENSRAARETVQITVADDGPGIPQSARRHLFDPFYSGREAGRGLGLGLSKCWRIVTQHGGRIEVDSTPGQGARFTISLPVRP